MRFRLNVDININTNTITKSRTFCSQLQIILDVRKIIVSRLYLIMFNVVSQVHAYVGPAKALSCSSPATEEATEKSSFNLRLMMCMNVPWALFLNSLLWLPQGTSL